MYFPVTTALTFLSLIDREHKIELSKHLIINQLNQLA